MPTYLIPYLIAAGVTLLVAIIIAVGYFALKQNSVSQNYENQLNDLIDYNSTETDENTKPNIIERWNKYWGTLFKDVGITRYSDLNSTAGRDVLILAGVIFALVTVFLRNPLIGISVAVVTIYILNMGLRFKAEQKSNQINDQLPGFLFAMKANIQANQTTERALLKVVDNMPSPLYEDLLIAKNRILASSTFVEAISEMGAKTKSRDLKFLCACMTQASESGANMEHQITVIQKVLEDRRKVSDELNKAVRSVMPSIYVATFVLPAAFIFSYLQSDIAREFWFKGGIAWVCFIIIVFLYAIGMWLSKKLVDGIKNT